MAFDITLTSGMRSNLVSLQATTLLQQRTQSRLSSGKSVNTAVDDPAKYFAAQDHTNHASDLSARKADMGEAIQGVKAANQGITSINTLINQAKGLVQSASSANTTTRASLAAQFNTIRTQIDQLASDSGYNGKNFLQGDTLAVLFNESGSSSLTVQGFTGNSVGLGISTAANGKAAITASYSNESLGTTFVDGNKVNFAHVGEVSSVVVTQRVDATNDANVAAAAAATINGSTITLAHAGKVSNLTIYEIDRCHERGCDRVRKRVGWRRQRRFHYGQRGFGRHHVSDAYYLRGHGPGRPYASRFGHRLYGQLR